MFGLSSGKPVTCKPFAVLHQVFAAFCLLVIVGLRLGQLSYPDELVYCKQKSEVSVVLFHQPKNCKTCSRVL